MDWPAWIQGTAKPIRGVPYVTTAEKAALLRSTTFYAFNMELRYQAQQSSLLDHDVNPILEGDLRASALGPLYHAYWSWKLQQ